MMNKTKAKRVRERKWMSQRAAGRELPVSASTLRVLAREDIFYAPDIEELGGLPDGVVMRPPKLYHREHVFLMDAVLSGDMDVEEARVRHELWRARRRAAAASGGQG